MRDPALGSRKSQSFLRVLGGRAYPAAPCPSTRSIRSMRSPLSPHPIADPADPPERAAPPDHPADEENDSPHARAKHADRHNHHETPPL